MDSARMSNSAAEKLHRLRTRAERYGWQMTDECLAESESESESESDIRGVQG
jgi:hypothetical protein